MASYNGYEVKRGDVYYVRFDKSYGSEMSVGRPVVVVSANGVEKTYSMFTCVFMTTTDCTSKPLGVSLTSTPKASWALCNQLYSFDECRLKDYMCTLSNEEMEQIDAGLALALGLNLHDPSVNEKYRDKLAAQTKEHEQELAALKAAHEKELAAVRDEALKQLVDYDLCKRKYEYAMERMTTMIVCSDINARSRVAEQKPVVEEPVAAVAEEPVVAEEPTPVEEEPELINLNKCGLGDLTGLGFSMATAKMIVAARPYFDVDDLRGVSGVTRIAYQLVEKKITVGDTAEYRKKAAPKAAPKVVEPPKPQKAKKININTASAVEIKDFTGMPMTVAYAITGHRKREGLYTSVDQIVPLPRVGEKVLEKYGDKLEV